MYRSVDYYRDAYEKFLALEEGQSTKKLAEAVGVTPRTIRNWRTKPKPDWYHTRKQIDDSKLEAVDRLLSDGASYAEAARTVGLNVETVREHFPGRGWSPKQVIDHVVTMNKFRKQMRRMGI